MAKKHKNCMQQANAHKTRCEGNALVLTALSPMVNRALLLAAIIVLAVLGYSPLAIALAPLLGK
ncbi:hypothetical protein [Guptibacillus spartinae]|uniref:hypothetical protein n=1 Tax=Guptibacillus spartinae TaxID=3025679 RepID=UPI00236112CE|nr:hypothetical protein [Pseudalkalibacillus spartinae]